MEGLGGKPFAEADEAIECLFPIDGSGKIGLLRCGIDASRRNGGIFTVAAVTFGLQSAKVANRKWKAALDGRTFHMTDLNARRGDFEGISDEDVAKIMKATVAIIRDHAHSVVAVACDASQLSADQFPASAAQDPIRHETLPALQSVYGLMCHMCMAAVGEMCRGRRDVSYTLEAGDEGQSGLIRHLNFVETHPDSSQLRDVYSFRRKTITTKDDIEGLFHSADLVAWEFGKNVERRLSGDNRRRTSYEMIADGKNRYFAYFSPANLQNFLTAYGRILLATETKDVADAIRAWADARREFNPLSQHH